MPSKLAADILNYTDQVPDFHTSEHILDALDIIASEHCKLHVLGAALMPVEFKRGSDGYELSKTVFLHRSVPKGWWGDYLRMTNLSPAPSMIMARLAIGPYTLSEVLQLRGGPVGTPSEHTLLRRETKLFSKTSDGSAKAAAHHSTLEAFSHVSG